MLRTTMSPSGLLRFLVFRFWCSLKAATEYRASFWSQVIFMILNNGFLLWFWQLFFAHFSSQLSPGGGWRAEELYLLYGVVSCSFGLANLFAGGAFELASAIADGELDYFLALPVPTLLHALVTRIRVSAFGDLAFGWVVLFVLAKGSLTGFLLSVLVCLPAALVFVAVTVLASSLGFYIGESRGITVQLANLLMTFSTYPTAIFQGSMRWVIYLLVPAAFFAHLPSGVIQGYLLGHDREVIRQLLLLLAGTASFAVAAVAVFYRGLRNYSSGSAVGIRS